MLALSFSFSLLLLVNLIALLSHIDLLKVLVSGLVAVLDRQWLRLRGYQTIKQAL